MKSQVNNEFEVAFWDYAALVVLALKDLTRTGYQLIESEQIIADGSSLNFEKIRGTTWAKMPLHTRQDIARARNHRDSIRRQLKQN